MVIKVLTRKSGQINSLIKYVFKDKGVPENEKNNPMILKKNLNGPVERWAKQISLNNSLRKAKSKQMIHVYHSIIAFHPKDGEKITKKILKDIGQKFVDLRGADAQHIITVHTDKIPHLHCITGGTKLLTGIANRQTKQEFKKMKVELERYQMERYPDLSNSLVQSKDKKSRATKIKNTRTSTKEKLNNELAELYTQSTSMNSFYQSVQNKGYALYERSGRVTGIIDKDLKYRFAKLGFDKDKLNHLDSQEHQTEMQMQELDDIRSSRSTSRDIDELDRSRTIEQEREQEEERDDGIEQDQSDDDLVR